MSAVASRRLSAARSAGTAALRHPLALWALGAALCGALGFALFGSTPGRSGRDVAPPAEWALEVPAAPSTAEAQALLASKATWASQPAPVDPAEAAAQAAPPPVLIGVIQPRTRPLALFQMPDGTRVRAAAGDTLPDGSAVLAIEPTRVRWKNAAGEERATRLFDARGT